MRDILNTGVRLLIITLVAALLLSGTYLLTRGPIARHEIESEHASRLAVVPDASSFEVVDEAVFTGAGGIDGMREVYKVFKDGELYGYTFLITTQGYSGQIPVTVGILIDGRISAISIGDIMETQGIGTQILDESYISQYAGLATNELNRVDAISHATISSDAVKKAVRGAFNAYALLGGGGAE